MADESAEENKKPALGGARDRGFWRRLRSRAIEEAKRFYVMVGYIWLWSALFELHQRIILRQSGIGATSQGFALVNALILAKVMLVAEDLKLARWLRPEPLIYPILGESLIFTVVFIAFHLAEHEIIGLLHGETLVASIPAIGGGGFAGLLSVAVIYFVALVPFFGFRNVSRELGEGRLKAILFGAPGASNRHP